MASPSGITLSFLTSTSRSVSPSSVPLTKGAHGRPKPCSGVSPGRAATLLPECPACAALAAQLIQLFPGQLLPVLCTPSPETPQLCHQHILSRH